MLVYHGPCESKMGSMAPQSLFPCRCCRPERRSRTRHI